MVFVGANLRQGERIQSIVHYSVKRNLDQINRRRNLSVNFVVSHSKGVPSIMQGGFVVGRVLDCGRRLMGN